MLKSLRIVFIASDMILRLLGGFMAYSFMANYLEATSLVYGQIHENTATFFGCMFLVLLFLIPGV